MKIMKKTLQSLALLVLLLGGVMLATTGCVSTMTYEDGMFDSDEFQDDSSSETLLLNSELDADDAEKY